MNIFVCEKYIFKTGRGDLMAPNNFRGIVNKMDAYRGKHRHSESMNRGIVPISTVCVTA